MQRWHLMLHFENIEKLQTTKIRRQKIYKSGFGQRGGVLLISNEITPPSPKRVATITTWATHAINGSGGHDPAASRSVMRIMTLATTP